MRASKKELQQELLKVFHYFDFFNHPLLVNEVWKYAGVKLTIAQVEFTLNTLVDQGKLVLQDGFYALSDNSFIISERISNLKLNAKRHRQAKLISKVLNHLPFVKGVGISGSLSKNGATPGSDIDFFLITDIHKVWTVKALAIILKKLLFFGSHKYLCVNYLLAQDNLSLKKKNQFQAIEAITLIPVYGNAVFKSFFEQNDWITEYYPNNYPPNHFEVLDRTSWFKKMMEFIFDGQFGENFELKAMNAFEKHGVSKYGKKEGSNVSYKRNESVYFPNDFETIVLENYEQRIRVLSSQSI
ncbi:MAG: nucleotidyltransferase domain-containing protein [Bacteroidia bacterium]